VDHVLMATGYQINVRKYSFLSESLASALRLMDGCPMLGPGFESSVPGLHFLGAPAVWSFGPLMRFVAGADFAARAVSHAAVRAGYSASSIGQPAAQTLRTSQNVAVSRSSEDA
jgi:hypothetical protein